MTALTLDKQLLLFLNEVGIGQYRVINDFLAQNFPAPTSELDYYSQLNVVKQFIDALSEQGFIQTDFDTEIATRELLANGHFTTPIRAMILKDGVEYIFKQNLAAGNIYNVKGKNINVTTGSTGVSNKNIIAQPVKGKSDLATKVKKWVAVLSAIAALIFLIVKGIFFLKDRISTKQQGIEIKKIDSAKMPINPGVHADTITGKKALVNTGVKKINDTSQLHRGGVTRPSSTNSIRHLKSKEFEEILARINYIPQPEPLVVIYFDSTSTAASNFSNEIYLKLRENDIACIRWPHFDFAYKFRDRIGSCLYMDKPKDDANVTLRQIVISVVN